MSRIDAAELADLKSRTPLSDLFGRYGVRGRGKAGGSAIWTRCCFHAEKSASLKINDQRGVYHCFGCGASGDHFDVLRELGGKSFGEAVEVLGGARLLTTEERAAIAERQRVFDEEERRSRERARTASERIFGAAVPLAGTHAEAYLAARHLPVVPRWTFDLRFVASLAYRGFPDENADDPVDLGAFPAMVAAIRDRDGKQIGLHRTYLDPARPAKVTPPGDARRNKAKKVMGDMLGGMILLSPPARSLVVGEGIETSQSWFALGLAGDENMAVAAGITLGNMSGSSTGSSPHPVRDGATIPNGIPDMDRPGMLLPRHVEHVTLLGDGDSEPYMTRARLLVGARRFHRQGVGVSVCMAPDGKDFSNVLADESAS